jgi:multicomponent Na+:H+ antiporter subunit D
LNAHLPVLQIVVPLIAAPLCLVLRREAWVRVFASLVAWATFACSIALLIEVRCAGAISYALGGWPPPLGIEYRVDAMNAFVLVIVSMIAAVVLPTGPGARAHALPRGREHLYYAVFLLCEAGLLGSPSPVTSSTSSSSSRLRRSPPTSWSARGATGAPCGRRSRTW